MACLNSNYKRLWMLSNLTPHVILPYGQGDFQILLGLPKAHFACTLASANRTEHTSIFKTSQIQSF